MMKKLIELKKEFNDLTVELKELGLNDPDLYKKLWDQRVDVRWSIIEIEQKIVKLQINLATYMELGDRDKADQCRKELIDSGLLSTEEIESLTKYV